ncbi:dihydrodipicolinate synthase family protein [Pelagibius sp. CAU 1746]|uniref:dihydrodipicolinate synthase family protein n=1 Tax=Pelagibius sp. CAU 1746 TaxID=3140370 RepID=UPI00325A7682
MTKDDLHGFVPAVVTPFSNDGEILEDDYCAMVEWLIGLGATGICVAGDNGESWALSANERGRLTARARDVARGRAWIMTGCSAPTLDGSLAYAREAAANGAQALLMMPPTYVLKGSRGEILRRYESVSKEIDLPIVLYNSPRRVGYSLGLEDLDAVMQIAPVIGIKESHRDFFHHSHLLDKFRERLSIMIGPCHYILPGLALGAKGFIATGPELLGAAAGRLVDLAKTAPGREHGELHIKLTTVYELLMGLGTWPAAFKAALNLIGQPAGVPRDPVLALDPAQIAGLRSSLNALGIETR